MLIHFFKIKFHRCTLLCTLLIVNLYENERTFANRWILMNILSTLKVTNATSSIFNNFKSFLLFRRLCSIFKPYLRILSWPIISSNFCHITDDNHAGSSHLWKVFQQIYLQAKILKHKIILHGSHNCKINWN